MGDVVPARQLVSHADILPMAVMFYATGRAQYALAKARTYVLHRRCKVTYQRKFVGPT